MLLHPICSVHYKQIYTGSSIEIWNLCSAFTLVWFSTVVLFVKERDGFLFLVQSLDFIKIKSRNTSIFNCYFLCVWLFQSMTRIFLQTIVISGVFLAHGNKLSRLTGYGSQRTWTNLYILNIFFKATISINAKNWT